MLAPRLGGSRLGDQAVVDTNDDAQLSKLCVRGGSRAWGRAWWAAASASPPPAVAGRVRRRLAAPLAPFPQLLRAPRLLPGRFCTPLCAPADAPLAAHQSRCVLDSSSCCFWRSCFSML